ncbi:DUF1592 domain-containing protein [Stratiformator vulcanicus]|uniref:DUF1592 domain-containing protein n=1 Tax=Stratiformator vulcanicus TaxID=2527980 RepID=UPI0028778E93|nr:DUF1592 domain-containing protein [Stratiformator vulcanicus]
MKKPELVGRKAKCPKCGETVRLSEPERPQEEEFALQDAPRSDGDRSTERALKAKRQTRSGSSSDGGRNASNGAMPSSPSKSRSKPTAETKPKARSKSNSASPRGNGQSRKRKSQPEHDPFGFDSDDLAMGLDDFDEADAPAPRTARGRKLPARGGKQKRQGKKVAASGGPPIALLVGGGGLAAVALLGFVGWIVVGQLGGSPAAPGSQEVASTVDPAAGGSAQQTFVDANDSTVGANVSPTGNSTNRPTVTTPTASPPTVNYEPPPVQSAQLVSNGGETSLAELATKHDTFQSDVAPVLEQYCVFCHTADDPSGSIVLEGIDSPAEMLSAIRTWEKVGKTQRLKDMPPPDMEAPSDAERKKLIDFADGLSSALAQAKPFEPGPAIFRRLNRRQYANTVRDLFEIDFDAAVAVGLPEDQRAFGYDTIAAALDIPAVLMEKYVLAADKTLARVVVLNPDTFTFEVEDVDKTSTGTLPTDKRQGQTIPPPTEMRNGFFLTRLQTEFRFTADIAEAGTYVLKVRAWEHGKTSPDLAISVNGAVQRLLPIVASEKKPDLMEVPLTLQDGKAEISIGFNNPYHGKPWEKEERFLTLAVDRFELTGPVTAPGVDADPAAHARVFIAEPGNGKSARQAAQEIITKFGLRAYRRPIEQDELERFLSLFDIAQQRGASFEKSVKLMLKAAMISPSFLFRIERDRGPSGEFAVYAVDDYELASRLSYFLWSTMPDDELFQLAGEGRLSQPDVLDAQIKRMLEDERAKALVEDFFVQWLHLEELETALPSEEHFPEFNGTMRSSMRGEVTAMFDHLIESGGSVLDLIDADYTFVDRELRGLYRMDGHDQRGQYKKVNIDKRRNPERGGLLGMGGILAMTSHVARNSPTMRGKWVLDKMLGDPPPPPPANVEQIEEDDEKAVARTFRELLAQHASQSSSCGGCHKKMDPLGFALDNFNPIGRWQRDRSGEPIDSKGVLPDGRVVNGAVELKQLLMTEKDQFTRNLIEQMMIYALGRDVAFYDRPSLASIHNAMQSDDYSITQMIAGVAKSYPFRNRKNSDADTAASVALGSN